MFGYWWHQDLPELPVLLLPGLHVELVAVHPVVEHLRWAPLNVETGVTRAGQVGYQGPGRNIFRQSWVRGINIKQPQIKRPRPTFKSNFHVSCRKAVCKTGLLLKYFVIQFLFPSNQVKLNEPENPYFLKFQSCDNLVIGVGQPLGKLWKLWKLRLELKWNQFEGLQWFIILNDKISVTSRDKRSFPLFLFEKISISPLVCISGWGQTNDILLISPQVSLEVRKCSKFEPQKQVEDRGGQRNHTWGATKVIQAWTHKPLYLIYLSSVHHFLSFGGKDTV